MQITVPPTSRVDWRDRNAEAKTRWYNSSFDGSGNVWLTTVTVPPDKRAIIHTVSFSFRVSTAPVSAGELFTISELLPLGVGSGLTMEAQKTVEAVDDFMNYKIEPQLMLQPTDVFRAGGRKDDSPMFVNARIFILYTLFDA